MIIYINIVFCYISMIQKPPLKWAGGKSQIIEYIVDVFPKNIENYHELFLGGGSVLLAVLSLQSQDKLKIKGNIYAYDINQNLINLYINIQTNKNELYDYIINYMNIYDSLDGNVINRKAKSIEEAQTSKESYYYWLRKEFNELCKTDINNIKTSALFLILNKLCFRGIYREGPNGFNVPFGHYKTTPVIIKKENLDQISELIRNVSFQCLDFRESIKKVKKGDFVYLDPPYVPENKKSFVGYTSEGFNLEMHNTLFDDIMNLDKNKIKFVMSNANVDFVKERFKDYKCQTINARRAINSKKPESVTTEVIIRNQ